MKKIVFICPFFGILPKETFQLWLQSCKKNPTIDWMLFLDDSTNYDYPLNVKVEYCSFDNFRKRIQKKFDFRISITSPYKLCDYKPTYGYVFFDQIKKYDYWGHCDLGDCLFGNLRNFLTDDFLKSGEKFLFLGHMTLYKNSDEVNRRIFLQPKSGKDLEYILNGDNKAFDELNSESINTIYLEHNFQIKRFDQMFVDISPLRFAFQASCYDDDFKQYYAKWEPLIFEWNEGSLYECKIKCGKVCKREIGYVHFQKRKLLKKFDFSNSFVIVPNKIIALNFDIDASVVKKMSRNRMLYFPFFKLKWNALCYKLCHLKKV